MGPYKLLQPPRRWSRPHEPTSIMANAQRKNKNRIRRAWLPHCGYPSLTANLPNPTFYVNFRMFFYHIKPYTVARDSFRGYQSISSPKPAKIAELSLRGLRRSGWPLQGSNWPEK